MGAWERRRVDVLQRTPDRTTERRTPCLRNEDRDVVEEMVAKSVAELVAELSERTAQMGNHGDCAHDSASVQHATAPEGSHHWHYACEGARRANNLTLGGK